MIEKGMTLTCVNKEPLSGNEVAPPVTVGQQYKLQDIFICNCTQHHFNIGLKLEIGFVRCYKCGVRLPDTNHWCHPSRFEETQQP